MSDRPVVLLSERLGPVTDEERSTIEAAGATISNAPLWSHDDIRLHASGARLVILGAIEPFDAQVLADLPHLGAIVRRGVGTDNIDLKAATEHGIVVANVIDATVEEVSDHALALLLTLERRTAALNSGVREGASSRDASRIALIRQPIRRMNTLTLGIIGFGRIGSALARKARPLYHRVLASDPLAPASVAASVGAQLVELHELLAGADHISLHAPLEPSTRHLIDVNTLGKTRPGAVLVNTARGGLVDETALLDAVRRGQLAGAGLDVTEHEPIPPDDPLLDEDRILLTAHSAASSRSADDELRRRSIDAAIAILVHRRPESIANPAVVEVATLRIPLAD